MVIKDAQMVALVTEQADYFLTDAPQDKKVDVLKRIVKRQKQLAKGKGDD